MTRLLDREKLIFVVDIEQMIKIVVDNLYGKQADGLDTPISTMSFHELL